MKKSIIYSFCIDALGLTTALTGSFKAYGANVMSAETKKEIEEKLINTSQILKNENFLEDKYITNLTSRYDDNKIFKNFVVKMENEFIELACNEYSSDFTLLNKVKKSDIETKQKKQ